MVEGDVINIRIPASAKRNMMARVMMLSPTEAGMMEVSMVYKFQLMKRLK